MLEGITEKVNAAPMTSRSGVQMLFAGAILPDDESGAAVIPQEFFAVNADIACVPTKGNAGDVFLTI